MIVLYDTREQAPYLFQRYPDVTAQAATLTTTDYTLQGLQDRIGLERKSRECPGKVRLRRFEGGSPRGNAAPMGVGQDRRGCAAGCGRADIRKDGIIARRNITAQRRRSGGGTCRNGADIP